MNENRNRRGNPVHSCTVLNSGESGHVVDVAHVDTALEERVAVQSPTGAPRVAHDPVVAGSGGSSVADDDDAVVDGSSVSGAGGVAEHSGTFG